jgi:hypothetical protein
MNPKEWLEKNCPLKGNGHKCVTANQRGRLSAEHHAVLPNAVSVPADKPKPVKRENKAEVSANVEIAGLNLRFPEDEWEAYTHVDGKRVSVGMRECCDNCYSLLRQHYSLTDHRCENPRVSTVLGAGIVNVSIVPRTHPLPFPRW